MTVSFLPLQSGILPERNNFIECECFRLGEFAVTEDVETGYGWTLSAGLVMAFVIVSSLITCSIIIISYTPSVYTTI